MQLRDADTGVYYTAEELDGAVLVESIPYCDVFRLKDGRLATFLKQEPKQWDF